MGRIRPFRPDDIEAVVALRRRVFSHTQRPSDLDLAGYYETVFFRHPWHDDELTSLVFEGDGGHPVGFLGVIPRPMRYGAESIRCAACTEFMVSPEVRGLVGVQLMRQLFNGPQALTFTDRANEAARYMFEALGGHAPLWYSLYWTYPLRRSRYYSRTRSWPKLLRWTVRIGEPACNALESFRRRVAPAHVTGTSPPGRTKPLDREAVVRNLPNAVGRRQLYPVYTTETLGWLLDRLAERSDGDSLAARQVEDTSGDIIGWFICVGGAGTSAQVVQIAALPGHEMTVLQHLTHHARTRGAIALSGRMDRRILPQLSELGVHYSVAEPWTLVHSPRSDLTTELLSGRAFASRLEGEWWLTT